MKIDDFTMLALFTEYNLKFFDDILPIPEFKIRNSYFIFGYFSCKYDEYYNMYDCVLEISDRFNYTEEQLRDIFVHEMIHYYLAYTKRDLKMEHGNEFNEMATYLNETYGLHVTTKIPTAGYKLKPSFSLEYITARCTF